ncbi:hypothetical protein M408DRAFT_313285 [Serendipita vermifera MAFF 305830]|uniref:D-serine dehydratase n=1 Tax=Serendipita vermifera MAFF 305830 TaxID=933852 RepID=A0A0C2XVU8_SERVB|nr:hypothetical protein M408DRAFT_313285 [Serendipita vermifera MAFF 305830]
MSTYKLPTQTFTAHSIPTGSSKDELLRLFKGQPVDSLRTPALCIDRAIFAKNCEKMHDNVKVWGARFRAHVKTHKTIEGIRMQLQSHSGRTSAVIVSTLMEAWQIVAGGLVKDGTVDDILYGLPVSPNKLADLAKLADTMHAESENAKLRLMVDNMVQFQALEAYESNRGWSVFVKIDHGGRRAGLTIGSDELKALVSSLLSSSNISIFGFYCHAGDSYASTSPEQASSFLTTEMQTVNSAAMMALTLINGSKGQISAQNHQKPFVLSVGSTPTAHSTSFEGTPAARIAQELTGGELEIHAGNYPVCDLQQMNTGLVTAKNVAHRILTTVISYYPGRGSNGGDEALCDAGGIAMSRDTGPTAGYGLVIPWITDSSNALPCEWRLGRCSQEHGILVQIPRNSEIVQSSGNDATVSQGEAKSQLVPGEQLWIIGQHACLTCAAHPWYYVLDSGIEGGLNAVQDIWVPWKGW